MYPGYLNVCLIAIVAAILQPGCATSNLTFPAVECSGRRYGQYLHEIDCAVAIERFPRDLPGDVYYDSRAEKWIYPVFRAVAATSRHDLPQTKEYGTCVVIVTLGDNRAERSSWADIIGRAEEIKEECVEDEMGLGGAATVGMNDRIRVIIVSRWRASNALWLNANQTLSNLSDATSRER